MRTRPLLLSALVLLTHGSVAQAAAGEAATWSPPVLAPSAPAAPAPPPPAVAVAAPEAPAAEPMVGPEKPPAAAKEHRRARPARKACKSGKASCSRPRPPKVDPRLIEASAQRDRLLGVALPMAAAGRSGEAARLLGGAAEAHADPILYLAAAEAELTGPQVDGERLARAVRLAQEAQRLIEAPVDLRIATVEGPRLMEEAQLLAGYATRRQTQLRQVKRGKAELACGAGFLVLGATGLGVLASGAVLSSRVEVARGEYTGQDAGYLAALDATKDRAGTLLAAGLVSGLVGAAIGIPLTVVGSRDIKRARAEGRERPSFRFEPGLAGALIRGKF